MRSIQYNYFRFINNFQSLTPVLIATLCIYNSVLNLNIYSLRLLLRFKMVVNGGKVRVEVRNLIRNTFIRYEESIVENNLMNRIFQIIIQIDSLI